MSMQGARILHYYRRVYKINVVELNFQTIAIDFESFKKVA